MSLDQNQREFGDYIRSQIVNGFTDGQASIQGKYTELFQTAGDNLHGKLVNAVNESIGSQLNSIKAGDVVTQNDAARAATQKSSNTGLIILGVIGFLAYRFFKKGKVF